MLIHTNINILTNKKLKIVNNLKVSLVNSINSEYRIHFINMILMLIQYLYKYLFIKIKLINLKLTKLTLITTKKLFYTF